MATSCFFCQNLLSDYVEKILPTQRQNEVKNHLDGCSDCQSAHEDLLATEKLLNAVPVGDITNDVALRIMEASQGAKNVRSARTRIAKGALYLGAPLAVMLVVAALYPRSVPVVSRMLASSSIASRQFVRYYPLYHGAEDVLQAHGAFLEQNESISGSIWEQGGMSPEEFERTFQLQSGTGDEK